MTVRIINADVMDGLAQLESESVHCVVTSPPYFGLRDYGHGKQIGLEPTPDAYVAKMVEVFREVRRVLRKDGTCWLNLGDSYNSSAQFNSNKQARYCEQDGAGWAGHRKLISGLKTKDLIGIPWRVAFALQADGWWLRQDIIWSKPNPMPESVTDRCTKAHEYLFLLTKAERYFYDAEAIAEPFADERLGASGAKSHNYLHAIGRDTSATTLDVGSGANGRNKRSVWSVNPQPFPEAHFATFPPALIEPCIKAGCPERVCANCGSPWVNKEASCWCSIETISGTVLDPFGGSGTTGLVADRLKRNAILIELNPEYAAMAERRVKGDSPLFAEVSA